MILWVIRFFILILIVNIELGGLFIFFLLLYLFMFNINFRFFSVGLFSYFLIFLSLWLIYFLFKIKDNYFFIFSVFLVIFFLVFSVKKFLLFFFMFELRLVPTYFLVVWGTTPERSFAGNYLILYTFLGALPLLFSLVYVGLRESSFFFNEFFVGLVGLNIFLVTRAFLIKLPIFFFHLWLPKAHVEASTEGSMVLAGILLKLGRYGLILCAP